MSIKVRIDVPDNPSDTGVSDVQGFVSSEALQADAAELVLLAGLQFGVSA